MEKIRGFIKNPLGIIALFVTSIYGIAGLVIGPNFDNLQGGWERQPIIWFIILFPIVILWVFAYLVIKHNEKLYAPKDFDNQEGFLIANGKILKPHEKPKPLSNPEIIPVERRKGMYFFTYGKTDNAKTGYSVMEEVSMKRYADEHNMEIKTDVRITRDLACDGVAEKDGELFFFEVKVNYTPSRFENVMKSLSRLKAAIEKKTCTNVRLVLILVTEEKINEQLLMDMQNSASAIIPHLVIVNYKRNDILKEINNKKA